MPDARKRLPAMKAAGLPHATVAILFPNGIGHLLPTEAHNLKPIVEQLRALDQYLDRYTLFVDGKCPCCLKEPILEWTLVHGEAVCRCGWPYRVYHYDINAILRKLEKSLPYHPDALEVPTRKKKQSCSTPDTQKSGSAKTVIGSTA